MQDCHWNIILEQKDSLDWSEEYALGKKNKTLQDLWVIITFLPIVFFSDKFLVTILVLLVILNFYFAHLELKVTQDQIEIIGIYKNSRYEIMGLKESLFAICYSAQKSVSVWEKMI